MQVKPRDMKQAEMARTAYFVFVDKGVTKEDLLDPTTWAHVGHSLKMNDKIEVLAEDGSVYAELLVASSGVNFAKVRLIQFVRFDGPVTPEKEGDDYEATFISNRYKFGVRRLADNQWLVKDLDTQADAEAWLANHRKAIAA